MIFSGVVDNPESVISHEDVLVGDKGWDFLAPAANLKAALPSSSEPAPFEQ